MQLALRLARKGSGKTSPNPMVGAVLVKRGRIVGHGWHRRAGEAHAEIEALNDAQSKRSNPAGSTLYVTLEPCSTHGRTPPCTEALIRAGIRRIVIGATDPNPQHAGRASRILGSNGIDVSAGLLAEESCQLNEAFNHWIVHRTPFVTIKAAMTLDGKIATRSGESKWITGEKARAWGMRLRFGVDAILVGVNTILADDPALTFRPDKGFNWTKSRPLRRIVLDSEARTPLGARVITDVSTAPTTIVATKLASKRRMERLKSKVEVWLAPLRKGRIDIDWVLRRLGAEEVTSILVEGGGEVNASFLFNRCAHRVAFFYAPKIVGGSEARKAVAGEGIRLPSEILNLREIQWRKLGPDLLLTARVA
jgi:diaminohydroxyphosphoribosylaminopyrimidine deaminase / 5-amino-6-(5-phosphoribosylamino)uracil reductase